MLSSYKGARYLSLGRVILIIWDDDDGREEEEGEEKEGNGDRRVKGKENVMFI